MSRAPSTDLSTVDDIEAVVRAFYRDAATDDLLGPVFAGMEVDWSSHIDRLTTFWSWQLLGLSDYDGRLLRAHEAVHARFPLGPEHHRRWSELFTGTVRARHEGPIADAAVQCAARMSHALERLLGGEQAGGAEPVRAVLRR